MSVTVTLRSVGQGYSVTIVPWKVVVHKDPANGPAEIEWDWEAPQAGVTIDGAKVNFGKKKHFAGDKTKLGSKTSKAGKTGKVKSGVDKRTYVYTVTLYFTHNGEKERILIDPDYRVDA